MNKHIIFGVISVNESIPALHIKPLHSPGNFGCDDLLLLGSLWLFRLFLRVSHDVPGGGKVLKHAEPMFLLLPCSFGKFLLPSSGFNPAAEAPCNRVPLTIRRR
jgi:hypothetical protein